VYYQILIWPSSAYHYTNGPFIHSPTFRL